MFDLNEDQSFLKSTLKDFVDKEIIPNADGWNYHKEFPQSAVDQCAELGLLGVCVPKEYGGANLSAIDYAIAIEELSRGCASLGVIVSVNNSLAIDPILKHGSEAQKKQYLPELASGKTLGCFGLTEPGAGSDAGSQKTFYREDGDSFVINGTKNFITNGPQADLCIVFANKQGSTGNRSISAFIAEKSYQGYGIGKPEKKMGIQASGCCSLSFENMRVPKQNLLGEEGDGFKVALSTLDGGRIGIAAQAVGIGQAALEVSTKYAKERIQFDQPIGHFQGIRWMIANMAVAVDSARLLTLKAAYIRDKGQRHTLESAQAKLLAGDMASWVADRAVQIHGGYGYVKEYLPERLLRDARICSIYEGTSEIQRLVIANQILKQSELIFN